MRLAPILLITVLIAPSRAHADPPAWELMQTGEARAFRAVAVHPTQPQRIFAATDRILYESPDGGRTWQERFRLPHDTQAVSLVVGPFEPTTILLASNRGLYGSLDGSARWSRLFRGRNDAEAHGVQVAFHPTRTDVVFLGTRGGLFVSTDHGKHWQPAKTPLAAREMAGFAVHPTDPDHLYLVTADRLFDGSVTSGTWRESFRVLRPVETEAAPPEGSTADEEQTGEEPQPPPRLSAVALDPQAASTIYLSGSLGLQMSTDGGTTWRHVPDTGLPSVDISRFLLRRHSPLAVYAATPRGVARLDTEHGHWETTTQGLAASPVTDLAASPTHLWAATSEGLYRYEIPPVDFPEPEPPSARELLNDLPPEPTIAQVQQAAIRYAEVHPAKIARWRRQAALKALLPTVKVGVDHDTSHDAHFDKGTFPKFQLVETTDKDAGLDLSVNWDLGNLIWNSDQTSIDVRSKLMVQLRNDIVDEVTRTYFERRRLQVALLTAPPADPQASLEKTLRLQELTALIDGLTGGYFSAHTQPHDN